MINIIKELRYLGRRKFSLAANIAKDISKTNKLSDKIRQDVIGDQKSLSIAVVGVPNAGKSTFINNIINHRVCPTSSKVHTTCSANKAISTTGNTQLIFYDTPGLVTQREIKKHQLGQSFKSSYRHAIQHANIIAVIHDASNTYTRHELHSTVLDTLRAYPALPSFLVLNKIDAIKSKRILLKLIQILTNNTLQLAGRKEDFKSKENNNETLPAEELKNFQPGWSGFSDVFMVSSATGDGLNKILEHLLKQAKPKSWEYSVNEFTDKTPEDLIVDSVRARLLDYLPQEIPYQLSSQIEYYSEEKNAIFASVQVICPSVRLERLICGESNGRLRQITERVTSDLVETFKKKISLTVSTRAVNSKKDE